MNHLSDIKFVGDLSLQDADILAMYGRKSSSILEFGCGGSTQIFSQCKPQSLVSVDTSRQWIDVTKKRLQKVVGTEVHFVLTDNWLNNIPPGTYDLIFVDGIDHLRRKFAIDYWDKLKDNGVMIFHDTRRFADFQNAAWVAQLHFNEISQIDVNAKASCGNSSNMTVLHKKPLENYVNWNHVEGKPLHAYGDPSYDGDLF